MVRSAYKFSLRVSNFLEEISILALSVVFLYFFSLFTQAGFLISLLFFGTLHLDGYIFPFFLCLSLLFFPQLFPRPLEKGMATHSIILAWRMPWTEEPGGLQSKGWHRVGHNWSKLAHTPFQNSWCLLFLPWHGLFNFIKHSLRLYSSLTSTFLIAAWKGCCSISAICKHWLTTWVCKEVLQEHSHTQLFTYALWLLLFSNIKTE